MLGVGGFTSGGVIIPGAAGATPAPGTGSVGPGEPGVIAVSCAIDAALVPIAIAKRTDLINIRLFIATPFTRRAQLRHSILSLTPCCQQRRMSHCAIGFVCRT